MKGNDDGSKELLELVVADEEEVNSVGGLEPWPLLGVEMGIWCPGWRNDEKRALTGRERLTSRVS